MDLVAEPVGPPVPGFGMNQQIGLGPPLPQGLDPRRLLAVFHEQETQREMVQQMAQFFRVQLRVEHTGRAAQPLGRQGEQQSFRSGAGQQDQAVAAAEPPQGEHLGQLRHFRLQLRPAAFHPAPGDPAADGNGLGTPVGLDLEPSWQGLGGIVPITHTAEFGHGESPLDWLVPKLSAWAEMNVLHNRRVSSRF